MGTPYLPKIAPRLVGRKFPPNERYTMADVDRIMGFIRMCGSNRMAVHCARRMGMSPRELMDFIAANWQSI